MESMKMKDAFPNAFQVEGNPSFGVQNCLWTTFGEDEQSTSDQDSAIEHAVLNHDRLVEENAELREFANKMISDITGRDREEAKHYWRNELDKLLNK